MARRVTWADIPPGGRVRMKGRTYAVEREGGARVVLVDRAGSRFPGDPDPTCEVETPDDEATADMLWCSHLTGVPMATLAEIVLMLKLGAREVES